MKIASWVISILIIISIIVFNNAGSMEINDSFYYRIIDADIIEIGNKDYWAFVIVDCEGVSRKCAFSHDCSHEIVFPNNAVRIATNKIKVCGGDKIFVFNDECTLGKIKKEKWPTRK